MDLAYTEEQNTFRTEVQDFLKDHLPPQLAAKVASGQRLSKHDHETWHAILNRRGWLAGAWPREFGGQEWNAVQRHIFEEEAARANAPRIMPFGVKMLAPVLQKFGSNQQKSHWLPRILSGEDWWCQGFSEPGAGSDLASLSTRAERQGDSFIVNGQKTWTTAAQHANMIFCLVRTALGTKPQEGISFLLIDMRSPGITVRSIELLDGEPEVNEVWFEGVRVPAANLVGEENQGWTYAKHLLTYERTNIAGVGHARAALANLKMIAGFERKGLRLADNSIFMSRVAQAEIDLMAMVTTNLRVIAKAESGEVPGADSSMLKIKGTQIRQELSKLARQAAGSFALPFVPEWLGNGRGEELLAPAFANAATQAYFNNRKLSIYGGSNEIQRQIIAKSILGL